MTQRRNWKKLLLSMAALMFLLTACAGQQSQPDSQATTEPDPQSAHAKVQESPLDKTYRDIVVADMTGSDEIKRDYRQMLDESRSNLLRELETNRTFKRVVRNRPGMKYTKDCLLIKTHVSDMRIVSMPARMIGGAFAGSSFMEIDVSLVDAATQTVLRKKHLSSSNNAWAAGWTDNTSDNKLPAQMGIIIAEYVNSVFYE